MGDSALTTSRNLLKVTSLVLIAGAAVAMRLYSVIRFESIIHEFDPWFNFRATKRLANEGFYSFLNWFDNRTWYPLGRVTGGTLYPGLMVSSNIIHTFLEWVGLPVDIRNVCVMFAPAFSGLTALMTYFIGCEVKDTTAGLLSALFVGLAPGYISRSVAGSYDNEAISITLMMATYYFWIKALKTGSALWGGLTALSYFYMVSAWGGYAFITNMIPLHVFILLLMGRYHPRIYVAYCSWYAIGTLASMQVPFVNFMPVLTSEHMSSLGIFGLLQLIAFASYIRSYITRKQFFTIVVSSSVVIVTVAAVGLVTLTYLEIIAPWTGRFYSLWDTAYAKIHIPIIASVSEHQPTAWTSFFFDTSFLVWLFPVGVYMSIQELRDEHVFIITYAILGAYFAGVMVRLMLVLTPLMCVCGGMAVSQILEIYSNSKGPGSWSGRLAVLVPFVGYLIMFVLHCDYVTQSVYSSPSVVLAAQRPDGSPLIIDDFREAYYWLRMNTADDAKVMSWWDYGYQIGGMADRTTLVDNNTWNNTHIATVGKAMCKDEDTAYKILQQHDVDYVLVVFGGVLGFSGDDINKFLWMVRIASGVWPDEVQEADYYSAGAYRQDSQATKTMLDSLMYKMSFYRFPEFNGGMDRIRGQLITHSPTLDVLEEAFTSENWLVRIFKVKKPDTFGRSLHQAAAYANK